MKKPSGQHFIIGLEAGTIPSPEALKFIKEYSIGGILFLGKNFSTVKDLCESVNLLNQASPDSPMMLTVDHEGGRVQRFKTGFTVLPSFRKYAENKNPTELFEYSKLVAQELLSCGVNFNYVPCADLTDEQKGVIGDRSVGTDVNKVSEAVKAVIRGHVKAGVLTSVKHFPGHGSVTIDTHLELPHCEKTFEELENYELIPFKKAMTSGVDSVMCAHIIYKNIDAVWPSSLSEVFMNYIRNNLKYSKLILTDDISMGAISKNYSPIDTAIRSLSIGVDMIIYSLPNINELANIIDAIEDQKRKSHDFGKKCDAALKRIAATKKLLKVKHIDYKVAEDFLNNSKLKSMS